MTPLRVHNQSKFRYPLTNLTTSDRWTVRSLRKWAILAVPKEPHPIDLILEMVFHLVGGLGIFLLGMKYMQQGLQVIAGSRIRRMISLVTSNRFLAVGIGLFVTTLVQSSSVTSVMVIGLVNSELMVLTEAIGVIIGANIGTTITGWILAMKIGHYGLPLLGVAAFGWLFLKAEKLRYTALSVLGIGMIFFGLEIMKDGFAPVRDLPDFAAVFQMFEATNYVGVLKSALVGCVATLIVQSSSATLGMTIALANTGVVDFQTAAALVMGTNMGTTITAYLASLGADDINAKRTAYFHVVFNVSGVIAITATLLPFICLSSRGSSWEAWIRICWRQTGASLT